jgi:hypothetical protein
MAYRTPLEARLARRGIKTIIEFGLIPRVLAEAAAS